MTALADRTINLLVRDRTRFGVGAIDDLAAVVREIGGGPDARDFDEVWIFDNPSGIASERWFHAAGCRRWLTVRRDTSIDEVLELR